MAVCAILDTLIEFWKGMIVCGAESVKVVWFIVKNYGVIERLPGFGLIRKM